MSMFGDNRYCWRETYLVMLDHLRHPETSEVVLGLKKLKGRIEISNTRSNANGLLESLIVLSQNDSSAVELQYREGADVTVEFAALADELERHDPTVGERKKIARAREFSAKIELLHFEQVQEIPQQKQSFPAKLTFPRYSGFIKNLNREIQADDEPNEFDSTEQLDPNTLILILKLISRITSGVAFDPASGIVL
jgi:hypothetical protein